MLPFSKFNSNNNNNTKRVIAYHGSSSDIKRFLKNKNFKRTNLNGGGGPYFVKDRRYAEIYARKKPGFLKKENRIIIKAELTFNKLFLYDNEYTLSEIRDILPKNLKRFMKEALFSKEESIAFLNNKLKISGEEIFFTLSGDNGYGIPLRPKIFSKALIKAGYDGLMFKAELTEDVDEVLPITEIYIVYNIKNIKILSKEPV